MKILSVLISMLSILLLLFSKPVYAKPNLTVFVRGIWLGALNSASDVDNFVSRYPGANAIMLTDTRNNLLNVISYTGWNESKTWGGMPYPQLKEVIDRFHYHGWKVILDVGLGWSQASYLKSVNDPLWLYLNNSHRELTFVNGEGKLRGLEGEDGSGLSDYNYLNYFRNYTTPDQERNISAGERYIDVYTSRLRKMIEDGSFEWDGWFGTDGWGGLNVENHYWLSPGQIFFGRVEGTANVKNWVSISDQEIDEWASSSYAPSEFPTARNVSFFSYSTDFDNEWKNSWMNISGTWSNTTDTYISSPNSLGSDMGNGKLKNIVENSTYLENYIMTFKGRTKYVGGSFAAWVRGENPSTSYVVRIDDYNNYVSIEKSRLSVNSTYFNPSTNWWNVKFVVNNTQDDTQTKIYLKVWEDGTAELLDWTLTYTDDSPLLAGTFGFWAVSNAARYDDLSVTGTGQTESWNEMDNVERGQWIRSNAPLSWYLYWQERWAKLWKQINDVFNVRPPEWHFGAMSVWERASTWTESVLGPIGMYNFSQLLYQNSFSHYWIQSGGIDLPRENAWSAGLGRSKYPEYHTVVYAPLFRNSLSYTKEIWLAQTITYVWKDGTRYRAVDPSWWGLHADSDKWVSKTYAAAKFDGFMDWAKTMYNVLGRSDLKPIYLGPTYVIPVYRKGISPLYNINYTFTQYVDVVNLMNKPQNVKNEMGTLILDMSSWQDSEGLTGLKDTILDSYVNGSLNLILFSGLYDNRFQIIFNGVGENEAKATFHMDTDGQGMSTNIHVLSESQLIDPYARWIANGYYGNSYSITYPGVYWNTSGFIPIVQYSDNRVSLGIYYNATSGRLVYIRSPIYPNELPRAMINRAIYWASESPINSSESLIDIKVFNLTDRTILMPMFNVKYIPTYDPNLLESPPIFSTLNINSTALDLDTPSNYIRYWQSDWNGRHVMNISDWNDIQITLEGGADILIIRPKPKQPKFLTANQLLQNETWNNETKQYKVSLGEQRPFNISVNSTFYIPSEIYLNDKFKVSCNGTSFNSYFNSSSRVLTVYCRV